MTKHLKNRKAFLIQFSKLLFIFAFTIIIPNYSSAQNPETHDDGWQFQSQREEIEPAHWIEKGILYNGENTLAMAGEGKAYVNGSWNYTYKVCSGKYYEFITFFKPENVTQIDRSVLAQITWKAENEERIKFIEFPAVKAKKTKDGWYIIKQIYQVPEGAVKAQIDLVYRWDAMGKVYFGGTSFKETDAIPSRLVRLGTIHYEPKNTNSSQENLNKFGKLLNIAGEQKADIVCLPEGITVAGTGKTYFDVCETIPGPTTRFLGQIAKNNNMYIVAGIYEKDGPVLYNTAVLMGRDGKLQGKYRKVAIPREEFDGGVTPGETFPVFHTDFETIGIMICWDVFFPETARMLALKGAEVIFMPIWGGNLILARARAIENQIYLVSSSYHMKTGVFDKAGELITEGTEEKPVVVVEVDLNQRKLFRTLGEFRNRIQRELPSSKAISY